MKTLKIVCVTIIALMVFPLISQAQTKGPIKAKDKMAERLDLSDEQMEQIKEIRMSFQEDLLPLRNQIKEKRAQIKTLTTGSDTDFEAAENVVAEVSEIRETIMTKRLRMHKEVRDILTEEQRLKFDMRKRNFLLNKEAGNKHKKRKMKGKKNKR